MAGMRSRQRMFAAVMRLLLKCLRLGRRRRFKLVRQAEQLWHYGHLCLRSLLYNSFTNGDVVLDSLFEPIYWLVDHVTRWFGVVFVALVIGLTSSIVAIVYICLLPLILQTYTPAWICWHLAYGHWNLIMIVFHYYMAITTSPGHPPQAKDDLTGVSICRKCIAPKPARTHHCSICNRHTTRPRHPPSPSASELSTRAWSTSGSFAGKGAQGLGARVLGEAACSPLPCDIAYPLPALGLSWLALAQMSLPCQFLSHREILALCHGRLDELTHLCSCGYRKAASAPHSCGTREGRPVCNLLSLAVPSSVALALGALTVWHAALITRGETSIERHINKKERQRLQKKGKVFRNPYSYGSWDNWKVFLGVDTPRHWLTRVLLPSPHLPHGTGLSWDLPPCVTKQRAPLLAI
uniref:Zinc finger DHHC-type containing 16 n=1 Tax=Accipiter nisus TaxID=211598 RepID=A0A8B9MVJ6_9AVES